ncbi:cyanophycinase [Sphingobacterium tabacisoli]|uniref:Cyanophycinase n=1 Tax=Sphingobacterium tabacisoli TaxID=2044855 RepID=A0ABW5KX70_9SPHI|nr:cyanophycinase [Sphingobacterium tabacisoli]
MERGFVVKYLVLIAFVCMAGFTLGQSKGSLFIIGGGDRSDALVNTLVRTANLRTSDYIVVLPMATSIPEESVEFISGQLLQHCDNAIASFNFTREEANEKQSWIDSVAHARLIYITGGDQNKFMNVVKGTKLYDALHKAHAQGATISGTSAGAAVMSAIMFTGEEKAGGSFKEVRKNNAETAQGMGYLTDAIIDQHFIIRSRYNRLLSVLADHPDKMLIGIDEGTAIIVKGKKATVAGDSQVVVVSAPKKLKVFGKDKVSFENATFSLFSEGQSFNIR